MSGYDITGALMAAFFLWAALGATVVAAARSPSFLKKRYPWWLCAAVAGSLLAPLVYRAMSPVEMSLADAYCLRVFEVGWRHVLVAYAALLGLVIGGIVALVKDRVGKQDS